MGVGGGRRTKASSIRCAPQADWSVRRPTAATTGHAALPPRPCAATYDTIFSRFYAFSAHPTRPWCMLYLVPMLIECCPLVLGILWFCCFVCVTNFGGFRCAGFIHGRSWGLCVPNHTVVALDMLEGRWSSARYNEVDIGSDRYSPARFRQHHRACDPGCDLHLYLCGVARWPSLHTL